MQLKFAHLADNASADALGKLSLTGIFGTVFNPTGKTPVSFPGFCLVAGLEARVAEGTDHRARVELVDPQTGRSIQLLEGPLRFMANGPNHPLGAALVIRFGPGMVVVSAHGDYEFRFLIDGRDVGAVSVSVLPRPPVPK